MGPYVGVDYNLTLCDVHSRVDSNTFTMSNPMPESTLNLYMPDSNLSNSQGLWIWPLGDLYTVQCRKACRDSD
jgi:hypothetical protein